MSSKNPYNFKLKNLKPENHFQVPDGYFEEFNERLQNRIAAESKPEPHKTQYLRLFRNQLAIAASFIGLMLITYSGIRFVLNRQDKLPGIQQSSIAGLSSDLDETMIYDLYNETFPTEKPNEAKESDLTAAMVDYLLLNDADIEGLMTEL